MITPTEFAESMRANGYVMGERGWVKMKFVPSPDGKGVLEYSVPVENELSLHEDIIKHCRKQWPPWKYIRARPDEASTIAKGCHDFTVFLPGRILCIECKKHNGKLSPEQQAWAKELEMLGHVVHVVRSFEEFLALVDTPRSS